MEQSKTPIRLLIAETGLIPANIDAATIAHALLGFALISTPFRRRFFRRATN
jgi:hypothetical protein